MKRITTLLAAAALAGATSLAFAQDIKIAHVYDKTGALEAYAKQTQAGLMLGLEYATGGTMSVLGRKIVVIEKDDQLKPDVAKSQLAAAYGDDKVDLAIGPTVFGVGAGDAAGGRGVQEGPAGRAGGGRLDHRRQVEPLHLPHRAQFDAGRDRRRGRAARERADRDAGAGLRVRPRRREGVQGSARRRRQQGDRSCTRSTCRRRPPTSPRRRSACSTRSRTSRAREIIAIIWAGAQPGHQARRPEARALRHRARARRQHPAGDEGLEGSRRHGRRDLLLLRLPEEQDERLAGRRAPEALRRRAARLLHRRRHGGGHRGRSRRSRRPAAPTPRS